MAKAATVQSSGIDKDLLQQIVTASATPEGFVYVSQTQGQPMLANNPPLIVVNTGLVDPNDGTKCAARATDAAAAYLAAQGASSSTSTSEAAKPVYEIITNAVLPPAKKRGNTSGSGAPTKYPFDKLELNQTFFSANTEHKKGDAVKALGSTVSAQNDKYSEPTGEMKTVTRAVRDKATKKAQVGPDGKKVTETVELPVKKYLRKFTIRPVEGGKNYGAWQAPADGALIARII
jgi:hypothetical protein